MPAFESIALTTDMRDTVYMKKEDLFNIKDLTWNQCEVTIHYIDGTKKTFVTERISNPSLDW